jgi:hypothetical protein
MKEKINTAVMVVTFGCWVAAVIDTVRCIIDPDLSIKDSWISWTIYMVLQIIRGIATGAFKEWASTMTFLIRMNRYQE